MARGYVPEPTQFVPPNISAPSLQTMQGDLPGWTQVLREQVAARPVKLTKAQQLMSWLRTKHLDETGAIALPPVQSPNVPGVVNMPTRAGQVIATRNAPRAMPQYTPTNYGNMTVQEFQAAQAQLNAPRTAGLAGPGGTMATMPEPNFRMAAQTPATIPPPNYGFYEAPSPATSLVRQGGGQNWNPFTGTANSSSTELVGTPRAPSAFSQGALGSASPQGQLGAGPTLPTPTGFGQELAGDVSALRGGLGAEATGVSGLGKWAQLKGELGALAPEGGLLAKTGGFIGKHQGIARGLAGAALVAGAEPTKNLVNEVGPKELGGAAHGAMEWGGTALMVPGIGPVAAPLAAIVGAGYGAVAEPLKDLYAVDHYKDFTGRFQKSINSKQLTNTALGDMYVKQARAIHNGEGSITDKALAMQKMNALMANARKAVKQGVIDPNDKSTWDGSGGGKADSKKQTATQIQMGEAMAKLAANSTARGAAESQMLQQMATDPNMAGIAPILQNDALQRANFGQQTADAYTGAAYLDLPMQRMEGQLAEMRALQQQIAQAKSSGGGSASLSDLASKVK